MKIIAHFLVTVSLPAALFAGPPPNFSDLMRMKRDQPVVPAKETAAMETKASSTVRRAPAVRAADRPAPRYKVVVSGPPKNAHPHIVHLPIISDEPVPSKIGD